MGGGGLSNDSSLTMQQQGCDLFMYYRVVHSVEVVGVEWNVQRLAM